MLDGVHLTLLIGPLPTPVPAPLPLVEALQSVQVNTGRNGSGFQLTFTLGKLSLIQTVLLPSGALDPMTTRVVIIVTVLGIPQVIMDGVVTQHQLSPGNDPGQSTLTLTGEDLTVLMGVVEMKLPYPCMPDAAKLASIIARYAMFGITPLVIPPPVDTAKNVTAGFEMQTGTDLDYIKGIAAQCGYTFYLQPGPLPATSVAYFGPDVSNPLPQPALSVNLDWATNVESLSFTLDGTSKQTTVVTILDPITGRIPVPVPLPDISIIKPPLGARPIPPAKILFSDEFASLAPEDAAKRVFGVLRQGADSITGTGSLSVARYGSVLSARGLVGVRGAGVAYDGLYYVDSVTHSIKRGEYKQNFTLSRDGMISLTPVVPALP